MSKIEHRKTVYSTPWFELVSKTMAGQDYYSVKVNDYCCILAITPDQNVVLVRQFRPAVETMTLELPAGHVDDGESAREASIREFTEETGFRVHPEKVQELGCLFSDTGRLTNRSWYFLAHDVEKIPDAQLEAGIEVVLVPLKELKNRLCTEYSHSMHVGALALAMLRANISF